MRRIQEIIENSIHITWVLFLYEIDKKDEGLCGKYRLIYMEIMLY